MQTIGSILLILYYWDPKRKYVRVQLRNYSNNRLFIFIFFNFNIFSVHIPTAYVCIADFPGTRAENGPKSPGGEKKSLLPSPAGEPGTKGQKKIVSPIVRYRPQSTLEWRNIFYAGVVRRPRPS